MIHGQAYAAGFHERCTVAGVSSADLIKRAQASGMTIPPALEIALQQPVVRDVVTRYLAGKVGKVAELARMVNMLGAQAPSGYNIL